MKDKFNQADYVLECSLRMYTSGPWGEWFVACGNDNVFDSLEAMERYVAQWSCAIQRYQVRKIR